MNKELIDHEGQVAAVVTAPDRYYGLKLLFDLPEQPPQLPEGWHGEAKPDDWYVATDPDGTLWLVGDIHFHQVVREQNALRLTGMIVPRCLDASVP